ncbi:large subunit ribosomal protein L31 [Streptomyces sp. 1222.5]|uniref:type B 50S ribosomal protein L31 n=1 Tax=unclassified Streptomyces TaxID=2593676 RepID=UPI000898E427|nr:MULTISPECIES: type B 50S ribosomal protein L31 [unclassified Streptomyces]PKW05636.1 large subunit ribosomal protein L31 [Streptomyces sp. 5112.2]SEC23350.1 large subunit ribosomal protein L31 [Streptomyces sp. 2231.1]SED33353.1 large subunit ribosomal protein L31 [Streptomyces sp. 1222.5]
MRPGIHPESRPVVFRDRAADALFLTRSTATASKTIEWRDGNTYPLIDVEISSAGHPVYTGKARVVDSAGRVERFERRYGRQAALRG